MLDNIHGDCYSFRDFIPRAATYSTPFAVLGNDPMISIQPMSKIDSFLARFGVIAWVSVILGTIMPALIANHNSVFYKKDLENRIIARNVQPAADIERQEAGLALRLKAVDLEITENLTAGKDLAAGKNLTSLRHEIETQVAHLDEEMIAGPFFLNDLMVAWSAMYIALGVLLFILLPKISGHTAPMSWKIAFAILAIYPLYQGPVWLRNFVLNNEQRRVFSFANYDICPASFWMQEVNTLIWLSLVALLWHHWFVIYKHRSAELSRNSQLPMDMASLTRFSETFLHWQLSSVILTAGFIVFTGVFWNLVIVNKDRRYLIPAIVVHIVWALSWMLLSLPLFATWQDFSRKKMRAILARAEGTIDAQNADQDIEALEKISPVALWNGFGSALTAVVSFIFPVIHALVK